MIRMLRDMKVRPMVIDQPIYLEVSESIVMQAVYLSIPEAENSRRGLTTSDGIRRAKKLGRWPGRAPIGYSNQTAPDCKKFIMPKQPEADLIKWSFQQLATGTLTISFGNLCIIQCIAVLRGKLKVKRIKLKSSKSFDLKTLKLEGCRGRSLN